VGTSTNNHTGRTAKRLCIVVCIHVEISVVINTQACSTENPHAGFQPGICQSTQSIMNHKSKIHPNERDIKPSIGRETAGYNHDKIVNRTYPHDIQNRKDRMNTKERKHVSCAPSPALLRVSLFRYFLYRLIARKCSQNIPPGPAICD